MTFTINVKKNVQQSNRNARLLNSSSLIFDPGSRVDRDAKKSKFSYCLAEFSVYFNGKSKNFLLKKFLNIFQNGGVNHGST